MAGGNISIDPASRIAGRAWLAGGRVDIAGEVGQELKAAGGELVISGNVNGDVQLAGETIRILDSAVIRGNLTYKSPVKAQIADGAQIQGTVHYEPVERHAATAAMLAAVIGVGIITLLSLFITSGALYLMYPGFLRKVISTPRTEFWKSLGLGLAILAATPVVIAILFSLVITWLPALVIGALYLLLLLFGFLCGVFYVADLVFGLHKRDTVSHGRRLLTFAVALIAVMLLSLIPRLGGLLLFILMLLGTGALKLCFYRAYQETGG